MWNAISKIFTRTSINTSGDQQPPEMNRRKSDMDEVFVTKQAKQRASVKWLLSKAFDNRVPEALREPFYRDHENQEHLKPQILLALANAEMYCLALGNIYSDPNYHNLSHSAILQTLARKGVEISEPSDIHLTETTLIQTNPLRMNAHMAVIEALMSLYAREVVTPDRVLAAVQRFSPSDLPAPAQPPADHEQGLLLWVSRTCEALRRRIENDSPVPNGGPDGDRLRAPELPRVSQLRDLCDGTALAALVSLYCPEEVPWTRVRVARSLQDSVANLTMVREFCEKCLPVQVFHLMPEDIAYMRDSFRQNLIVFMADLFNLMEIHPVKCVRVPGMDRYSNEDFPARNHHGVVHKRHLLQTVMSPIPDLRSGIDDPSPSGGGFQVPITTGLHQSLRRAASLQTGGGEANEDVQAMRRASEEEAFVVHRGRGVPTLRSVQEPLQPATLRPSKERQNRDTKQEERGEQQVAAGKPSNWEDSRKSSYAGRRSRRNSMSEDSQLTIENFGGSQDNLNFIGRNPDKEVAIHTGRKLSSPSLTYPPTPIENPAVRSTLQDARGSIRLGYEDSTSTDNPPTRSTLQDARGSIRLGYEDSTSTDNPPTRSTLQDARGSIRLGYEDSSPVENTPTRSSLKDARGTSRLVKEDLPFVENPPVRTSLQDARGSIRLGYDDPGGDEKQDRDSEKIRSGKLRRPPSIDNLSTAADKEALIKELVEEEVKQRLTGFAELKRKGLLGGEEQPPGIQLVYMQNERDEPPKVPPSNGAERKTTFAALPNQTTTTWQQQSSQQRTNGGMEGMNDAGDAPAPMGGQMNDIRLQLEAKRRQIENEKRRMELAVSRQRQKVGESAFLQAVSKGRGNLLKRSPTTDTGSVSEPSTPVPDTKPQRPTTLQDMKEDTGSHNLSERKWLMDGQSAVQFEPKRTPELENMDIEQYQKSIAQMNSSLYDIQADIQRLQAAQQQNLAAQQHQQQSQLQQQQQPPYQTPPYHHSYNHYQPQAYSSPLQGSASAPHIPQSLFQQPQQSPAGQFFLHDRPLHPPPVRRTWSQQPQPPPVIPEPRQPPRDLHQPLGSTWGKTREPGFLLHEDRYQESSRYQNGSHSFAMDHRQSMDHRQPVHHSNSFTLSQQHHAAVPATSHSTPSASPQHRPLVEDRRRQSPVSLQHLEPSVRRSPGGVIHAPIPAPPADDMEPQNISFIGNSREEEERQLSESIGRLNITSGSRTYRIPSPTRSGGSRLPAFHSAGTGQVEDIPAPHEVDQADAGDQKGFYISFDDEQPKRPKPPLRGRLQRGSPRKEQRSHGGDTIDHGMLPTEERRDMKLDREPEDDRSRTMRHSAEREFPTERQQRSARESVERVTTVPLERRESPSAAIVIGPELNDSDPLAADERERRKELVMLRSLQRRQQQEEARERKEAEAQARREREKAKEEERLRKKEEQAARRAAILEQHKMKKAIEEAEREGKVLDKQELMGSMRPTPKMRPHMAPSRPRPKTIHIDSGSVQMAAEGKLHHGGSKKGSTSNLTANSYGNSTMRRDYFRGSQDSLADRSLLHRDSPDDSRGVSPCHSANQTLGRRSSYKTSRDPSPGNAQSRASRPRYPTSYAPLRGRKSSSLMNLYHGSSTDQDSLAYRGYGDTDSGLGRATPPRRAPSPGMGGVRHLPSPSGPGSLPGGLLTRGRRIFDDGSSDLSSTASMTGEYNGPRLYRQPAAKSNKSIILNAVEYCVFPGAVNREAKRRVLEEINRAESKHFLILFRDAMCQFRALYSYCPDSEEVVKIYGTGPKQVNDRMFDKFFKYNSGGKCFSQVHTKHLTVTIDAFTIHNSLWQGKKTNLPSKKDMALVI